MKKRNIKKIYKGNEEKAKWTLWIVTLIILLFLPNIIGFFSSQVKNIDYSTF